MVPKRRSAKQAETARKNGARSRGRPVVPLTLPSEKAKPEAEPLDVQALLRAERARNFQFLIDLRNGLMPGYTLADRMRAVENMLDRDADTARVRGDIPPPPETLAPKLFEIGESGEFAPPDGWSETPLAPNGEQTSPNGGHGLDT